MKWEIYKSLYELVSSRMCAFQISQARWKESENTWRRIRAPGAATTPSTNTTPRSNMNRHTMKGGAGYFIPCLPINCKYILGWIDCWEVSYFGIRNSFLLCFPLWRSGPPAALPGRRAAHCCSAPSALRISACLWRHRSPEKNRLYQLGI